ncbi:MAG: hypothetical protein FJY98_00665 [Candidatus Liptonbacteria bacterium]|nr:hypothetical protein [Candidatus Liptonbacteria bacterium]
MWAPRRMWWYGGGVLLLMGVFLALFLTLPERTPSQFPKFGAVEPATPSSVKPPTASKTQSTGVVARLSRETSSSISITSPRPDEQWALKESHLVKWSKSPGVSGSLYLVNAMTKSVVGWISPTITPEQTSYSWDTQYLNISRTDPSRKEILPGRYIIRMELDRRPPAIAESAPFVIVYPDQIIKRTHQIELLNYAATPPQLTVHRGESIAFVNKDKVDHELLPAFNGTRQTLKVGESTTLNTEALSPGTYEYYSEKYPTVIFSFRVK